MATARPAAVAATVASARFTAGFAITAPVAAPVAARPAAVAAHSASAEHISAPAVSIKSVVMRIDRYIAAGNIDIERLNTFIAVLDQDAAV